MNPAPTTGITLTFPRDAVLAAARHSLDARDRSPTWGQTERNVPAGLWLVGDGGLYLMSNGRDERGAHGRTAHPPIYADGCHPADDHHAWGPLKTAIFGGDGVEFIPADDVLRTCEQAIGVIGVVFTEEHYDLISDPIP